MYMNVACVLFERVLDQQGRIDSSFLFNRLLATHIIRIWISLPSEITFRLNVKMEGEKHKHLPLNSLLYTELQSMSPSAGTESPSCMQIDQNLSCSHL